MTKEQIINNLELYTFGRPKKEQVSITVEKLQNLIDEIKALDQETNDCKIFGTKENCFGGATEYECNHCDYKIQKLEQQPSDDCISRQTVLDEVKSMPNVNPTYWIICDVVDRENLIDGIQSLPSVTPIHGTCKDCKHWKDSDGVYRRGIGAESKCPINIKEVYEGNFYCKDFDKRGNSDDSN